MTRARLASRCSKLISSFKRVIGMPDYAAYVQYFRAAHPEAPVPTEREYFDEFVAVKYAGGASRCC